MQQLLLNMSAVGLFGAGLDAPSAWPTLNRFSICNSQNETIHGRVPQGSVEVEARLKAAGIKSGTLHGTTLIVGGTFDCSSGKQMSKGISQEGNMFGHYANARAIAMAGNLDFIYVRHACQPPRSLFDVAPLVASKPRQDEPPSWAQQLVWPATTRTPMFCVGPGPRATV